MSHPFGNLLNQYLHRQHGLSQAKLAAGILQTPSVISEMCKGQRLTGAQSRERVLQIIHWLHGQAALETTGEADALLHAAGMAPLRESDTGEAVLLHSLRSTSQRSGKSVAMAEVAPPNGSLPQTNLPTPLTDLIGRKHELAEVKTIIAAHRFVTLTGPGGCGKTRLALSLAEQLRPAYSDGVFFVPLAPVTASELIAPTIASVMGLSLEGSKEPHLQLFDYLRQKEPLLVIDNVEHLLPKVGLFTHLLQQAPHLRLLATSREPLHLYGEHNYRLAGLLPHSQRIYDDIASLDAVRLFIHSAQRADATFQPDHRDLEDILYICKMVDGLPLGIELAASWVRLLACAEIRAEMEVNLSALEAPYADVPERHHSLNAVMKYSWDLLQPKEQSILRLLSVFQGGCDRAAAEQTANADLRTLSALVDKSLLSRESAGRYSMHEVVRQFAHEQLVAEGQQTEAKDRHLAYFVQLADQADRKIMGPEQFDWLPRVNNEIANVRGALSWCQNNPDRLQQGLRLVGGLGWYWLLSSHWREARIWAETFLQRTTPEDLSEERLMALFTAGAMSTAMDYHAVAKEYLLEALRIVQHFGNHWRRLRTISGLGVISFYLGELAEAKALLEESLSIKDTDEQNVDQAEYLYTLEYLGQTILLMGDHQRAYAIFQECLALNHQVGYTVSLPQTLIDLARVERILGDLESATAHLEESLVFADQFGILRFQSQIHNNLGWIALQRASASLARERFVAALRLYRQIGDRMGISEVLEGMAVMHGILAVWEDAAFLLGAADALREQIGVPVPAENRQLIGETRAALERQLPATEQSSFLTRGRTIVLDKLLDTLLDKG